jgi:hypothetical protein
MICSPEHFYRFLVVKSEVPNIYVDIIMESLYATFFENIFPTKYMHINTRFYSEIAPYFTTPVKSPFESFEQPYKEVFEKDDNKVPLRNKR